MHKRMNFYLRTLRRFLRLLDRIRFPYPVSRFLICLGCEPVALYREIRRLLFNRRPVRLPPFSLGPLETHYPIVLFLHGNRSDPGIWNPFVTLLRKKGFRGVILCPELTRYPHRKDRTHPVGRRDLRRIVQFQTAIARIYARNKHRPRLIVVGYSRGAELASAFYIRLHGKEKIACSGHDPSVRIEKVILIANSLEIPEEAQICLKTQKLINIAGDRDVLTRSPEHLHMDRFFSSLGHLGLMQSAEVIRYTVQQIMSS